MKKNLLRAVEELKVLIVAGFGKEKALPLLPTQTKNLFWSSLFEAP